MYDPVSYLWEGYKRGVFIGVYASEEDALEAVMEKAT
jgi:hypothetical protein